MMANRTKKIEDEAWELLDNAPEDSVLEGSSDLAHSSDLREEVEDLSSVPLAIHLIRLASWKNALVTFLTQGRRLKRCYV